MCSLSSSRRVTEVLPEAIALLHFCAQCRRYLKRWSRTKSCRSVSQTEFYLIASLASFPVAQLYGNCCLFWMTGMQQGKGAPQSMPPFCTWQKRLITLIDHQILIKKTGFFWPKLNLCRLVQKLLDRIRTNDSDHGGSC